LPANGQSPSLYAFGKRALFDLAEPLTRLLEAPDGTIRAFPGQESGVALRAYVLIQTEVGKAASVVRRLAEIEGVTTADDVTGPYDVIVQAEADSVDDLGKLVVSKVQLIEGITRTLTCPVVNL